mmetsp:Transcript_32866/g.105395  ORF Transcript_32866/g.105395 Transcript_32866/m.105395 type:complete len:234 (-) Transcript_32866:2196-2897(-)
MSACLSAPQSLPPSPHMTTLRPLRSCSMRITLALPGGDMRANTRSASKCDQMASSCSAASSIEPSVAISSYLSARPRISSARKGTTVASDAPVAATQRGPPPALSVRSSSAGLSGEQMRTSRATCSAVSGASPVSIDTWCAESSSAPTTIGESPRVLHAKAMKPAKTRSASASSRGSALALPSDSTSHTLYARASTRIPRSARPRYTSAYHAGSPPDRSSMRTASGEPLTSTR